MAVSPLQWLRENNEVFSEQCYIGQSRLQEKKKRVNGMELNNGDVEIVLVAHPCVRVHAVD